MEKLYPDSEVELTKFMAKHYDTILDLVTLYGYKKFINKAITDLDIKQNDKILDLACGTGRNILLMNKHLSKDSLLIGLDISKDMEKQFNTKCKKFSNIKFINKRIDQPFEFEQKFDKVFISFALHGFPHEIRKIIIKNAYNNLRSGGIFNILDYSKFDINKIPFHHRFIFKKIECKFAFDYIKRDWKNILKGYGFNNFKENLYFKKYVRLLKAEKL